MKFNRNFSLTNVEFIHFTNLSEDEKKEVLSWRNHQSVRKMMYDDSIIELNEHLSFIEKLKSDEQNSYWVVKTKQGEAIGVFYLNKIDQREKSAYLGIYANPDSDVKRKGTLVIEAGEELFFSAAGFKNLKLEVFKENEVACQFYLEKGFKQKEELKNFIKKDGKYLDVFVMEMIRL